MESSQCYNIWIAVKSAGRQKCGQGGWASEWGYWKWYKIQAVQETGFVKLASNVNIMIQIVVEIGMIETVIDKLEYLLSQKEIWIPPKRLETLIIEAV